MITVKYRGVLAELTGKLQEQIDAATVNDVMKYVKKTYSAAAYKEAKKLLIVINGDSILLHKGFKTPTSDGDTVSFLPVCGGG
ncbi:MAG: MoaD/ThiS family protein [Oscillospiraceae bacterium]|nr:MoaD/ThiS family protein [Oscillospiraceae bacterium]